MSIFASRLPYLLVVIALLITGCASTPPSPPQPAVKQINGIVRYALSLQGAPYRYGKSSPAEGFDCSGFVKHVYERHGIFLPRSANEMANALNPVAADKIRPGDLLFFNTSGRPFSHVGIYVQGDDFIHAPSQRTGKVLISSMHNQYWQKRFTGARRP